MLIMNQIQNTLPLGFLASEVTEQHTFYTSPYTRLIRRVYGDVLVTPNRESA